MAITRKESPEPEQELLLSINNGDYNALKEAAKRLGFRNEESLLRFALAVLSTSATRTLTVTDKDGKTVALNPTPSLLEEATPATSKP